MDDKRSALLAGWSGLVFSALSLIVIPLAPSIAPALGASGASFSQWYAEHHWGFLIGNYLGILAFLPGFVLLAVLTARIRHREGVTGWMGWLVFGTGAYAFAIFAASLILFQTMPFLTGPKLGVAAETLGTFSVIWFSLDGLAAMPFVLATGWAALSTEVLPRWFANLSFLVGGLCFLMSLGSLSATPTWFAAGGPLTALGFVAFFGWTTALSVVLLRTGRARKKR
jgi:hypothetical protein